MDEERQNPTALSSHIQEISSPPPISVRALSLSRGACREYSSLPPASAREQLHTPERECRRTGDSQRRENADARAREGRGNRSASRGGEVPRGEANRNIPRCRVVVVLSRGASRGRKGGGGCPAEPRCAARSSRNAAAISTRRRTRRGFTRTAHRRGRSADPKPPPNPSTSSASKAPRDARHRAPVRRARRARRVLHPGGGPGVGRTGLPRVRRRERARPRADDDAARDQGGRLRAPRLGSSSGGGAPPPVRLVRRLPDDDEETTRGTTTTTGSGTMSFGASPRRSPPVSSPRPSWNPRSSRFSIERGPLRARRRSASPAGTPSGAPWRWDCGCS